MLNFAIIENNLVKNIIVADSLSAAEEASNSICVEYTKENPAHVGLSYVDGVFEQPYFEEDLNWQIPQEN